MAVYGRDFAAAYNEEWVGFAERLWPFLSKAIARRNPRARTWLDLCCGTGGLLKLVGEQGFEAVGLDASPHQLRHARKNAPQARLVRADVCSFALPQKFDVITCLYDSFNYVTRPRDLARAFRAVRRHLAPRGVFLFDVNTLHAIQTNWREGTAVFRGPRRVIVMTPDSYDEKRAIATGRIIGFVKEGRLYRKFEELHSERGYTREELDALLARAGFAFTRYDAHTRSRPRKRSKRLIYVCQAADRR